MAESVVDIDQVTPDIDPLAIGTILNPLEEEFTHPFGGKPITLPAASVQEVEKTVGEGDKAKTKTVKTLVPSESTFPLPVCVHIAKHLAEKIIRDEHFSGIEAIKDEKRRYEEERKAIPDYKGRIFEKMKELVKTDSDFFGKDGMKESFIR